MITRKIADVYVFWPPGHTIRCFRVNFFCSRCVGRGRQGLRCALAVPQQTMRSERRRERNMLSATKIGMAFRHSVAAFGIGALLVMVAMPGFSASPDARTKKSRKIQNSTPAAAPLFRFGSHSKPADTTGSPAQPQRKSAVSTAALPAPVAPRTALQSEVPVVLVEKLPPEPVPKPVVYPDAVAPLNALSPTAPYKPPASGE